MDLLNFVKNYIPLEESDEQAKKSFVQFIEGFGDNLYTRDNLVAHISPACWIVNKDRNKVLLAHHNQLDKWAILGGHADGERDLLKVALKEAAEESNLKNIKPVYDYPVDLAVVVFPEHIKKGKLVPSHLHYYTVFMLEADENEKADINAEENSAVAWLDFDEISNKIKDKNDLTLFSRLVRKSRKDTE